MGRRETAVHRSTAPLVPALVPGLEPAPANPLPPTLRQAIRGCSTLLHLAIPGAVFIFITTILILELKIFFANDPVEPENDVDAAELDGTIVPEPVNEHEMPVEIPAVENIVGGAPGAPVPLLGSLNGILDHHAP